MTFISDYKCFFFVWFFDYVTEYYCRFKRSLKQFFLIIFSHNIEIRLWKRLLMNWNVVIVFAFSTLVLCFGIHAYLFSPDKGSCYVFRFETIVTNFLHLIVLYFKVIINPISKRQFVMLLCCIQENTYFAI